MNDNAVEFIEGAAQVVEYYGYWATFHDAEMVTLTITPEAQQITAIFEYNDLTANESHSGSSRITLHWQDVVKYMLMAEYTNYNVDSISEINFVEQNGWVETEIIPIDGISGKIRSRSVRVTQFEVLPE